MPIMSNTHTTTLNGEDLQSNEPIKTRKVRNSKFTSINFMTLPQIKAAKDVLNKKLGETGNSPAVQAKLTELLDEYERSEAEIRKWYRNYSNNPKTKALFQGKEVLKELTIAKINGKTSYLRGDKHIKYGFRDKLRNTNLDKWGLGIGVTALGLGVAGQITSATAGKSLMELLKIAIEAMWKNNPVALVALLGGAGLIAASKIVPAIDRTATKTARAIRQDRMKVNAANNLAYEGANLEADAKFTEEANAQRPETQAEQPTVTSELEEENASEASTPVGRATPAREEAEAGETGRTTTESEEKKTEDVSKITAENEELKIRLEDSDKRANEAVRNANIQQVRADLLAAKNGKFTSKDTDWTNEVKDRAKALGIELTDEEIERIANEMKGYVKETPNKSGSYQFKYEGEGQEKREE